VSYRPEISSFSMIIFFIVKINDVLPSNQHDKGIKFFSFITPFVCKKIELLLLKYLINEYSISFEF